MYDHWLHCGRKHFCHYSLQAFSATEIVKSHVNDCSKINGKQMIMMPSKCVHIRLKNFAWKIKSPFMIYADFGNILVPENNGKQNPDESYTNKYQKPIACNNRYKLVGVDDKVSKPCKTLHIEIVISRLN